MLATLPLTAGTWTFDPNHSGVSFKVRHLGLTNVRGRFNSVDAWLEVGDQLDSTRFGATIDIASIDTNQADRDAHLRSTDFFAADQNPTLTFESTAIREVGNDEYEADGDLTINGITKPVTFEVDFDGYTLDPWGNDRAGVYAQASVNRHDWGITWNAPLDGGGVMLSDKVKLELDLQIVKPRTE